VRAGDPDRFSDVLQVRCQGDAYLALPGKPIVKNHHTVSGTNLTMMEPRVKSMEDISGEAVFQEFQNLYDEVVRLAKQSRRHIPGAPALTNSGPLKLHSHKFVRRRETLELVIRVLFVRGTGHCEGVQNDERRPVRTIRAPSEIDLVPPFGFEISHQKSIQVPRVPVLPKGLSVNADEGDLHGIEQAVMSRDYKCSPTAAEIYTSKSGNPERRRERIVSAADRSS
jgi:hypothetical protein